MNDQNNARKVTKRISEVENNLNTFKKLSKDLESLKEWFEISEKDTEEWEILMTELNSFTELIEEFSIQTLLSEPYDNNNCILTIQAGAGGTEAQDWAEMLQRMYLRYASRMNYKTEILDYQPGDEAGIKSVMIMISGPFAYGYLKAEIGIHRLVRISPFDANKNVIHHLLQLKLFLKLMMTWKLILKKKILKLTYTAQAVPVVSRLTQPIQR